MGVMGGASLSRRGVASKPERWGSRQRGGAPAIKAPGGGAVGGARGGRRGVALDAPPLPAAPGVPVTRQRRQPPPAGRIPQPGASRSRGPAGPGTDEAGLERRRAGPGETRGAAGPRAASGAVRGRGLQLRIYAPGVLRGAGLSAAAVGMFCRLPVCGSRAGLCSAAQAGAGGRGGERRPLGPLGTADRHLRASGRHPLAPGRSREGKGLRQKDGGTEAKADRLGAERGREEGQRSP